MSYGLYISAEGAMAQEYRMQTISNNIANLETPGFKRELAIQMARHAESIALGEIESDTGCITDIGGGVHTIGTLTEFKQGPIQETKVPSDLAIQGEGWFRVRDMSNNEEFLTRAGNFQVDRNGMFVTEWGHSRFQLLDTDGMPMMVPDANSATWHISDDGVIQDARINSGRTQQIALVNPRDMKQMVKTGENVYRLEGQYDDIAADERPRIREKHLEMSSTNPSTEMIEMIIASRSLEMNVKMMHTQDEATGNLLNRILRVA
ncbi:MAG: flagellar hook basal-body protein [Planctomycetaceae bacterium]|nr:flagellar hook basal-body protein [Planctomycetaceae bacterium]